MSSVIPQACQIRMARSALGWTIKDLAHHANVSEKTIQRLEKQSKNQASTVQTIENIVAAVERHGVVFISAGEDGMGPGVRLRNPNHRG